MRNAKLALFSVSVLLFSSNAFSQEESTGHTEASGGWVSVGLGSCYFGPTFQAGVSYTYNENVFSVGYLKGDEFQFNVEGIHNEPALSFKEIGVMYGQAYRKQYVVLSLLGGVGFLNGINRGKQIAFHEFEQVNMTTLSIPLEAEVRIEVTNNIGIGSSFFGSLNAKKTFFGAIVKIFVGKFS
ncbi:MAG: hypothetical protein KGJ59_09240 [Bacteroidota bacterium]|nr:hypothetical protein [Bacteroidota bacterium]